MAISKIVKRVGEKPYSKEGKPTVYYVSLELENGDKGNMYAQSSGMYKEGEMSPEYDLKVEGNFSNLVLRKTGNNSFQKKEWKGADLEAQFCSFSFSYTKDLIVAGKVDIKDIITISEKMAFGMQVLYNKLKVSSTPSDVK